MHEKCFNIAVDTLIRAIDKARRGDFSDVGAKIPASYFSFPTAEQWSKFRNRGRCII